MKLGDIVNVSSLVVADRPQEGGLWPHESRNQRFTEALRQEALEAAAGDRDLLRFEQRTAQRC